MQESCARSDIDSLKMPRYTWNEIGSVASLSNRWYSTLDDESWIVEGSVALTDIQDLDLIYKIRDARIVIKRRSPDV